MIDLELMRKLTEIPAVSGHEDPMIRFLRTYMEERADRVRMDKLGNVAATIDGTDPNAPSIMVLSHMDEVGLMVRRIEPNGFLRVVRIGGIEERSLLSTQVRVITGKGEVPGVVGLEAHHVRPPEKKYVIPPADKMYVDVGANSCEDVEEMGIKVGDPITYMPNFREYGSGLIMSKTMDNRAPLTVLLQALDHFSKEKPKATIHFTASVLEEMNQRGPLPMARILKPDAVLNLEVCIATDTPDLAGVAADIRLGNGPAVYLYSFHGRGTLGGLFPHPGLLNQAERIAEKEGIPLQREVVIGVVTETAWLQLEGEGIPSMDFGLPCRYTHCPNEVISKKDAENLLKLVLSFLESLDRDFRLVRG